MMCESATSTFDRDEDVAHITIRTVGYEGASIEDFVATLLQQEVSLLLDIRERPSSRRPGFSRTSLRATLEAAGIKYLHLRPLGDPKEGRDAARRGDYVRFETIFRTHLAKPEAQAALDMLLSQAEDHAICLMCYERDPKVCHRQIVVEEAMKRKNFRVRHLGVPYRLRSRNRWSS